jgi:dTDP-4-amino-4,6-dideoxygalactose transaminase
MLKRNTILEPRKDFLQFARPTITEDEITEVIECLKSGWITTGPRVKKFEEMLADYHKAPHALCINSATAGLHLALLSLNAQEGDEVITTSYTFIATLNTIVQAGLKPVLVDIDPKTYQIDVNQIEAAITPKTKAILPVHYAGAPADLDVIYDLAKKHNLQVIEDAAHSIGTEYKGKRIGTFGNIQVFSFHPNKNMTTGEGGCIICHDDATAKKMNVYKFHGIDRDSFNRFSKSGSQEYDVIYPGYKYNMLDIQAAIGIHQLPKLEDFIEKRTYFAKRYYDLLSDVDALILPDAPAYAHKHAWHLFIPLLDIDKVNFTRNEFINKLKELNIGTGLHYQACHLYTYYKETYGYKKGDFPNTEYVADRCLSLPLFPTMTEADQDQVVEAIKHVLERG